MRKRGRPRRGPGREPDPLDALDLAPLKIDLEPLKVELPDFNLDALDIKSLAPDELPELPDIKLEPIELDLVDLNVDLEPVNLDLPELDLDRLPDPLVDEPRKARKRGSRRPPAR